MQNQDTLCMNYRGMVEVDPWQAVLNHPRVPNLDGLNNSTGWPTVGAV